MQNPERSRPLSVVSRGTAASSGVLQNGIHAASPDINSTPPRRVLTALSLSLSGAFRVDIVFFEPAVQGRTAHTIPFPSPGGEPFPAAAGGRYRLIIAALFHAR